MPAPLPHRLRSLGATGPRVSPLALGCMGMSGVYGPARDTESVATIHAALDAGVTLFDTGDFYGMGHNELLLGRVFRESPHRRDFAVISVKFGALRGPDGAMFGVDTRPAAIKNFLAYSLTRLGVGHVDIYRPARLDPQVPIEDTVGAIADLVQAGYVRHVGLSEVGAETVRRAHAVHPIADLQIEYSLVSRGPEAAIFPVLRELGIGATVYGVLSRGLLTGSRAGAYDMRARMPRFTDENRAQNQTLVDALARLARAKDVTPAQLAIAWIFGREADTGVDLIPVIGARTRAQLADALGAIPVILSARERAELEQAVSPAAVAGTRYDATHMQALDSER